MIKLLNILKEITVNKPGDPNWPKVYNYIENGSKGKLDLSNTDIKRLPNSLKKVGGNLWLNDTSITSLPDGLTVRGYLDLRNTPITSLPDGLTVGGGLDLSSTQITSLPDGLIVGGNLYLRNTPLSQTHTEEQIRQMTPGVKGNIYI